MPHSYASVADLTASLPTETDGLSTARMLAMLINASERLDRALGRTFRVYHGVKYLTPEGVNPQRVYTPDLLAVSLLLTDDGAATYVTAWTTGDYHLWPYDAPDNAAPYRAIERAINGRRHFPALPRAVEVSGKWGYWERLEDTGATLADDAGDSGPVPIDDETLFSPGQTLLIDAEQVFVRGTTALIPGVPADPGDPDAEPEPIPPTPEIPEVPATLIVDRGVNGTAAAAHDQGATVYRYVYPDALRAGLLALIGAGFAPRDPGVKMEKVGDITVMYQDANLTRAVIDGVIDSAGLSVYRRPGVFA